MPTAIFHLITGAPQPVAPYSHAVESDGWVFLTGQIPNNPGDDLAPLPEGIEAPDSPGDGQPHARIGRPGTGSG